MNDSRAIGPASNSSVQVPPRPDMASAMVTRDPGIIADAIITLRSRQRYLEDFINQGKDRDSLPIGGTGQPASQELAGIKNELRTLSFRLAYATTGKALVPPLPQFDVINKAYDPSGRPIQQVVDAVNRIGDAKVKDLVSSIINVSGNAMAFQTQILQFEGARGFNRNDTPQPDDAFKIARSKVEALRAQRRKDPAAKGSIRSDVLESARKSRSWDPLFDALWTSLQKFIEVRERQTQGETPAETRRKLENLIANLKQKLDTRGTLSDDEWDEYLEASSQLERYGR